MYADQIAAGAKRSIKERLDGDLGGGFSRSNVASAKRQRLNDDKWKHDLYEDDKNQKTLSTKFWDLPIFVTSSSLFCCALNFINNVSHYCTVESVDPNDLRWKLQKKGPQQSNKSGSVSVVRDLRDKLSGTMHSQPPNSEPSKGKRVSEFSETIRKNLQHDLPAPKTKSVADPAPRKASQRRSELSVDGFLHSLGLEKYLITFQAEEVDMGTLKHMNDDDLRALGIPMGPRKKILLALESKV